MAGPTPMALGPHVFEAHGFGFTDVNRQLDTSWAELDVAMRFDALHWTGPKSETVSIRGVLFPQEFGGLDTLESLRRAAQNGEPMQLVSGRGQVFGRYVVVGIDEDRELHDASGRPLRNAYTLQLRRYTGAAGSALSVLTRLF